MCLTNKTSCFSIKMKLLPHPLTINGRAGGVWQEEQPEACVSPELTDLWRPCSGHLQPLD